MNRLRKHAFTQIKEDLGKISQHENVKIKNLIKNQKESEEKFL